MPALDSASLSQRYEIDRLVRQGAASLAASSYAYWPSSGGNECPEANVSLHLGHALLSEGYLCFAEAHRQEMTDQRFDLFALQPRERLFVVGECKRLLGSEDARHMVNDANRILRFSPQGPAWRYPGLDLVHGWGLLAAITWKESFARWFNTNEKSPADPTDGGLLKLEEALPAEGRTWWNSFTLLDHYDENGEPRRHYLVYAIFPLGDLRAKRPG